MVWREYSASRSRRPSASVTDAARSPSLAPAARSAIALAAAVALVAGCADGGPGGSSGAAGGGGTEAVGELGLPPFLAASRAVDVEQLSVDVTVGSQRVGSVERSGDVWIATFTLPSADEPGFPADGNFPIEVLWSYAVTGRAEPIPIARAERTVTLDTSRAIRINEYRTDEFDADGDGIDNFTEIDAGTSPVPGGGDDPGLAARSDQGDCRTTRLPGALAVDENAPRDVFRFGDQIFADTVALELDGERRVYYATLVLERSGTVTIEHLTGLPVNTNALLYDRNTTAVGFEGSAIVRVLANDGDIADGVPARISVRIAQRGLYCYALFDEIGDDFADGALLTDIVLRVEFTPDTF